MSAPAATAAPRRPLTMVSGIALIGALAIALASGAPHVVAVLVIAVGLGAAAVLLAPAAWSALRRYRSLILLIVTLALVTTWVVAGLQRASGPWPEYFRYEAGSPFPFVSAPYATNVAPYSAWPWRVGHTALLPLVLAVLAALGGLVLLSDAARLQLGLAPRRWVPWQLVTAPRQQRQGIAWRAIPGVVLIAGAAVLGIALANRYVAGDTTHQAVVLIAISAAAATLVGAPLTIGWIMRVDRDQAGTARELERQRFAAHLHDSVLQTLALVQRQAHDPAAVARLARRQEHALRAWMAGESELVSETLAAALRDAVAEVEDEYGMTIELTAIGDRPLDPAGEALVAAAREALRNAGRHAAGAPVFAFGEITAKRVEVFVRDEGPGFEPDAVAAERRGIRDAVIGRMAMVGGRAVIESTPGEGTEVALLLGRDGK